MKIALIATHSWPIPGPARTGDIYVLDLAKGLDALGLDVTLFAPEGTQFKNVRPTGCASGQFAPTALEHDTYSKYRGELHAFDIVHDHSTSKVIAYRVDAFGRHVCATLTGGPWREPHPPKNLCTFSTSQQERVSRGATDYEGSPTPDMGGPLGRPAASHVVYAGVDTEFYAPSDYNKDNYYLWLNRWHPAKGYELAVRIAKETSIRLLMAGTDPGDTTNEHERQCAREAERLAARVPNIDFRWLPLDPDHDRMKRELYRRAKALLYTVQFQEPFGLSMVEALACGTPVVGSRMGSVPEIVQEGRTGHVCNLDADAVKSFVAGLDAASKLVPQDCHDDAVRRFSRDAMARAYLREYEAILAGRTW